MTKITRYTLDQYDRAIELKEEGFGSQRIVEKLLNSLNIETILNSRYNLMLKRNMHVLRVRNKSRKDYLKNIGFSIGRKKERLQSYIK